MDWFYRILDVEYGIELAVRDARRVTTWQAAVFGLFINVVMLAAFFGIWVRYDLWSTLTVFNPVKDQILSLTPEASAWRITGGWVLGIAAAFFTSFVQWSYPRLSKQHDAAMWALAAASIFDIATDYPDVKRDFPGFFQGLITMVNAQGWERWAAVSALCLVLGFVLSRQRGPLWFLAGLAGACVVLPLAGITTSTIWEWGIVFVATIFCSFVAQSLFIIHAAKVLALFAAFRAQRGGAAYREA